MSRQAEHTDTWRRIVARALVVLGVVVAAIAILAGYLRWQAFDEDTFRNTASELIANDAVRNEIAATTVEALFGNVDVQADLAERLPADQQPLAGPIAAGIRELADRIAVELLERPRVQALWREAAGTAHTELLRVLRDEVPAVQVQDSAVVLDLRALVLRLGERIAIFGDLADRLPPEAGRIRLMEAGQLERAQDLTSLFENIAAWIWVVPLLLWALAIWLARGRRRIEVRAIALGLVVAGLLVLVARSLAGKYVVDELATTTSVKAAAGDAWEILTALLADGAWAFITLGLVALLGVWLAGATASGTASRRWLAPVLARPELTYGILAVLYVLFIWWEPFAQARRPVYLLVAAVLLAIGVEALRRVTAREFPDAVEVEPRELLRPLGRLWPGGGQRGEATQPGNEIDQLERLARLREQGVLTDDELTAAKSRLLNVA